MRPSTLSYQRFSLTMGSSLSFGSSARHKFGLFTLAFTMAPGITPLTKRRTANSLARSTKSTPSSRRTPTLYKHKVSDTISSPSRGAFHLSLTVLVRYRSPNLFSLGRWSSQIQAGLHVSDPTQEHSRNLPYFRRRDYYPLWLGFPAAFD